MRDKNADVPIGATKEIFMRNIAKIAFASAAIALASPTMAANTGTLVGVNIAAITSAGNSNNDDVGLTITYLNALFGRSDIVYLGTRGGPGNNAPPPPAGETIGGSFSGAFGTFTSSPFYVLAYDVKAANDNALYRITAPGVLSGSFDSTALINNGGQTPDISHADFFGVRGTVPEPATWAMMLVGFGGIGMAMRRGRKGNLKLAQLA